MQHIHMFYPCAAYVKKFAINFFRTYINGVTNNKRFSQRLCASAVNIFSFKFFHDCNRCVSSCLIATGMGHTGGYSAHISLVVFFFYRCFFQHSVRPGHLKKRTGRDRLNRNTVI